MTTYVVLTVATLVDTPETPGWTEVGRADAQNDIAAIKAVAKEMQTDMSRGAVAVPVRHWRPRKPERRVEERTLWT